MNNTIRKLLSLLLCLVMALSLFPAAALAEDARDAASSQAETTAQDFRKRTITQNYDEDTAVSVTLNNLDRESRLVIELVDRNSKTVFAEFKISVDEEDRVERIEHFVEGSLTTTRWLVYESGQLSSYILELNNESPVVVGGLSGSSCVLSNTQGELWLWGGPGAPEPFDTTKWEEIDWGSTTIMDSFDLYSLSLYSPDPFFLDFYYDVYVGSLYLSGDGFLSELSLFDFTYSDGLTEQCYDSSLSYMATYQYDDGLGGWVGHYDDDFNSFVEVRDELAPDEAWSSASRYFTVYGVDHAVFLDDSGRTVRLLLRSFDSGEICADYRMDWDDDQIQAITRLDKQGNQVIRHEFQYEEDVFSCDRITTECTVDYMDYTRQSASWSDRYEVMPDETGVKAVFNDLVDTREVDIYGDVFLENLSIYRDGNIFRLILRDDKGESVVDITFNMGTITGYKGGALWVDSFTTSELNEAENAWEHTSYDKDWNVTG